MENKELDEKTLVISRAVGVALVVAGLYGLLISLKYLKSN